MLIGVKSGAFKARSLLCINTQQASLPSTSVWFLFRFYVTRSSDWKWKTLISDFPMLNNWNSPTLDGHESEPSVYDVIKADGKWDFIAVNLFSHRNLVCSAITRNAISIFFFFLTFRAEMKTLLWFELSTCAQKFLFFQLSTRWVLIPRRFFFRMCGRKNFYLRTLEMRRA